MIFRIMLSLRSAHCFFFAILISLTSLEVDAQVNSKKLTLEGQFVCSECWFEADRKKTPYGSQADIQCAQDCAVKGVPPAVAVKQEDDFRLYLIESGQFKKNSEEWLAYIGKVVQVTGQVETKKNREYIAVDELKVIAAMGDAASQLNVVGTEADLALKDLFGIEQKLSAYRGKIVVVNFWATWCIPCRKEMPDLAAIQNQYAALGVQVVGASADKISDREKVLQFVKETLINFPVWLGATTEDMKRFGLGPALPGTALIDRNGKIVFFKPTVITRAELKREIDHLLAADSMALAREPGAIRNPPLETSLVPS